MAIRTAGSFLEERRLDRAKQLLTSSDLSLAEIAVECGFASQSRLTTTFRRRTGFTPAQFRRGRRGGLRQGPAEQPTPARRARTPDRN
jgi:AraC-like DNA-binding protein